MLEPVDGHKHKPQCTSKGCAWGCPAARRRQELEFGLEHHKNCTPSYCDARCPLARALRG
jgi:hypothetical protein